MRVKSNSIFDEKGEMKPESISKAMAQLAKYESISKAMAQLAKYAKIIYGSKRKYLICG